MQDEQRGTTLIAAIGSDGVRPVVWGLATTDASAIAEACQQDHDGTWADDGSATCEISQEIVDQIRQGVVDCAALGILVSVSYGMITGAVMRSALHS